jgi:MYXO-CTERM domain-containing protein
VRRLVIAAVAAATLACVPAAAAKEVTSATVCGVDGCTTTQNRAFLQALMNGGGPADPPAHPSGAFRVRARIAEPGGGIIGRFTNWWVPRTQLLLAEDGSWTTLSPRAAEAVASAAHGHKPFGPEKLGASFAGTSPHAGPPPPVKTTPVADDGASVDWWMIVPAAGLALAAAGALLLVRRRPGGATP